MASFFETEIRTAVLMGHVIFLLMSHDVINPHVM